MACHALTGLGVFERIRAEADMVAQVVRRLY